MPFFSIVMPVYGVEKYIAKAIDSIKGQTFTDWELIVVNDCTKDKSGEIAEEAAKADNRIRVVHHDINRGLSAARNTGITESGGNYIWFMDSDDYVDNSILKSVFDSLQQNPAQIVVTGLSEEYYEPDGKFSYAHEVLPDEHCFTNKKQVRGYIIKLEQSTLYGYAWNKFYNLSYLKEIGIEYETVTLIEDIVFNAVFCMDIESMNTIAAAPYHYAKRLDNSLTNKFVPDYFKLHRRRIEMIYKQYEYWGMCTEQVKSVLGALYARYIVSAVERNCDPRSGMNHKDRKDFVKISEF